ncbi:unnamed protein product, partial [Hapterophycus canaliculatus]
VGKLDSSKVVGFDIEWHAPRVRGISPSKTSLIQICSSAGYSAVFLVAVLGSVPARLWALLCDPTVKNVGNNITGDVNKLHKDFPELNGQFANSCELTSLTSRPTANRRLADLVTMVSGKEMDKERGGGALIDWTASSFSRDELLNASSDAWAGLFVWDALE